MIYDEHGKNIGAPEDCEHAASMPAFDEDAARDLDAHEVRKRWPRFFGRCAGCGEQVILYASWAHYIGGDW